MSYILDALQKAEAEREQGRVPGLKSQIQSPNRREPAPGLTVRPWHAGVALAALLVALLAGWWWWSGDTASTPAENPDAGQTAPPLASAQPAAPTPAPQATPSPDTPAATASRPAAPAEPVLPILAPARPPPAPPAAPKVANAAPTAAVPAPSAAPAAAAPVPAPATAPVAKPSAVPSFGQLTAEARAQLPAVNVSGSTYSQNPALRMLIANGKVVQEGQDIAPGLRLETIGPRSAVLNHQGMRYSIGY
ncbi:MAG: general secretion pathway protein GspB [Hydrogenophaga sp.]|uniref:general secretion pathway protein GspB n=1 Tax=Hydrogenophaga sp. TaxID=1904254 RepID=UPI0026256513|nr:general secretion pathway protein GspB [Hydrogenophaga sp.]MDM7943027.1 general secretion pathway protein GspB [Hydrogenophaga sp.]